MPNLLVDRFNVSSVNKVWCLDDFKLPFKNPQHKLSILPVIDLASRKIINSVITTNQFNSSHVTRMMRYLIIKAQLPDFENKESRLIIHTDRDNHFCSKNWLSLQEEFPLKIQISMSESHSPKQNAVSERLNRTIKYMQFEELLQSNEFIQLKDYISSLEIGEKSSKQLHATVKAAINHYNEKHVHTHNNAFPSVAHHVLETAYEIIGEPSIIAARNNETSPIEHRIAVHEYKKLAQEEFNKLKSLEKEETLTPNEIFILEQTKKVIKSETKKLAHLSHAHFITMSKQMDDVQSTIEELKNKVRKRSSEKTHMPLRDPILRPIFDQIINYRKFYLKKQAAISYSQFRITFVVLFSTGARINEIRRLEYDELKNVKKTERLRLFQSKVNEPRLCYLGQELIELFEHIEDDIEFIFKTNNFKYLGSTLKEPNDVMSNISWIRAFNKSLDKLSEELGIGLNLQSHSLRIGYVTRTLSITDIYDTAMMIGHKSLATTQRYSRYRLGSAQFKNIGDKAAQVSSEKHFDTEKLKY
jgi:integrase/recombinase XerD